MSQGAVLDVAFRLVAGDDPAAATMAAIAKEAGVSKATLYKWWPDRQALLVDALLRWASREFPIAATGPAARAVHQHVRRYVAVLGGDFGRVLRCLAAEDLRTLSGPLMLTTHYFAHRRQLGAEVIARGQAAGHIQSTRPSLDLFDQIYGTVFYRFLFRLGTLDRAYLRELVDSTFENRPAVPG